MNDVGSPTVDICTLSRLFAANGSSGNNGCLVIIGDDCGSHLMRAYFRNDIQIFQLFSGIDIDHVEDPTQLFAPLLKKKVRKGDGGRKLAPVIGANGILTQILASENQEFYYQNR